MRRFQSSPSTRNQLCLAVVLSLGVFSLDATAQVAPSRDTTRSAPTLVMDTVTFRATVMLVDSQRLILSAPAAGKVVELHMAPELLRRLTEFRGRTFQALAREFPTPGGLQTAIVLREGTTLRAVAENLRDGQLLRPVDRNGIRVSLGRTDSAKLVYQDNCKAVYNVPAVFTIDHEEVVIQPYETRTVTVASGSYTISVGASQSTVPKQCPATFEGSRALIEYVIVKNR